VIQLTEEPYDGEVAAAFVEALLADLNDRYAAEDGFTPEEAATEDELYRAEIQPEAVRRPTGTFVVAWRAGQPVGCGALRPTGSPGVAEIKRMYVAPEARRQGVSRLVLSHLEATAAELGYARIILETGTAQPEALALYESSGWERIEPYGHWKDAPSSVCFGKDVRPLGA
jgi:GNAT superfamily N-acetyltransferase